MRIANSFALGPTFGIHAWTVNVIQNHLVCCMSNETRVRDGTAHQARSHNGHLTQVVHFEEYSILIFTVNYPLSIMGFKKRVGQVI